MASNHTHDDDAPSLTSEDAGALIETIPGLAGAMASCGYCPPARTLLTTRTQPESSVDLRDPEGEQKDSFPPRYGLERQLHSARSIVLELSAILAEDALDTKLPVDAELARTFRQARSILTQLANALKQ
jgi:hypothetical protein